MRPADLVQEFDIDPAPIWPAEDGRLEPIFLTDVAPQDGAEFAPLNDAPAEEAADTPPPLDYRQSSGTEPHAAPQRGTPAASLFGSLGVHLAVLLSLLTWSSSPAE